MFWRDERAGLCRFAAAAGVGLFIRNRAATLDGRALAAIKFELHEKLKGAGILDSSAFFYLQNGFLYELQGLAGRLLEAGCSR